MTVTPTPQEVIAAMEATWPPVSTRRLGPWLLRDGAGGGKRVSAATVQDVWHPHDIAMVEGAMPAPLFMLRPEDAELDAALAARGYRVLDPVVAYAAPVAAFEPPPRMTTFAHWPPLQIATELWAQGGIGPARTAVMHRATGMKTALLARHGDRAAGVAFVAVSNGLGMVHALEIAPAQRRQGSAQNLLAAAAHWARDHGADSLALVVTAANAPARALYDRMGMRPVTRYHYRQQEPE